MGRRPHASAVSWNCEHAAQQLENMALFPGRWSLHLNRSTGMAVNTAFLRWRIPPPACCSGAYTPRAKPPSWACGMLTCKSTLIRPNMHASRRVDQSLAQGDPNPHSLKPCAAASCSAASQVKHTPPTHMQASVACVCTLTVQTVQG